mgnify:CR=1 FL=1
MKIALVIAFFTLAVLILKITILKGSIRQIRREFKERDELNSSAKIGISFRDADLCGLTDDLNKTLEKMRKKYNLYVQGDSEVKQTIGNASHDLRTPLTAIIGYLELAKGKMQAGEDITSYLDIIENRARYMKELTDELFEFSGIIGDNDREELQTEEIEINRVLEDSIIDYYSVLSENGIEPLVEITEEPVVRFLNRHALERIFANLLNNAVKYSQGDLKITLAGSGEITFENYAPELTEIQVQQLFDRFYTLRTGRNSTGLGLAIARNLVTQLNGTIAAKRIEKNLVIRISFPKQPGEC